jgi:ATP-dependent helicase/nuclease subunit A
MRVVIRGRGDTSEFRLIEGCWTSESGVRIELGALLADETIATVLQTHYSGNEATARAVQAFIQLHGGGRDKSVRALVLRLHHYTQTLPGTEQWFAEQQKLLETEQPGAWLGWLGDLLVDWPADWRFFLTRSAATNDLAKICLVLADRIAIAPDRALAAAALNEILAVRKNCARGKRGAWVTPLKEFFEEAEFLASLATIGTDGDPLADDWNCVRAHTKTLLDLTREFQTAFADAKRELGMLDFHDLEQFALRLLRDPKTGQPTDIARQWRQKLRFVFVDEYQDINAAQDKIIEALSRDGTDRVEQPVVVEQRELARDAQFAQQRAVRGE